MIQNIDEKFQSNVLDTLNAYSMFDLQKGFTDYRISSNKRPW